MRECGDSAAGESPISTTRNGRKAGIGSAKAATGATAYHRKRFAGIGGRPCGNRSGILGLRIAHDADEAYGIADCVGGAARSQGAGIHFTDFRCDGDSLRPDSGLAAPAVGHAFRPGAVLSRCGQNYRAFSQHRSTDRITGRSIPGIDSGGGPACAQLGEPKKLLSRLSHRECLAVPCQPTDAWVYGGADECVIPEADRSD